jgi:tRNA pseudouridine38-40 synthase
MLMRVAIGLEYRGTAYCGWQSQPEACGVQDYVERALSRFLDASDSVRIHCAGRTDAGVHALEQVIHLDAEIVREPQSWVRGTNAFLPADIRILWAHVLDSALAADFHARFSAHSRTYQYILQNRAVSPGVMLGGVGWFHLPLQIEPMCEAASHLLGEHDFSAFRSAECQAKSPIKTLHELKIERVGDCILFTVRANAFLHHMVRNLVGSLVYVGAGKQPPSWIAEVLATRDRAAAAPTFSADGLYLTAIEYDQKFGLPQNAESSSLPGVLQ